MQPLASPLFRVGSGAAQPPLINIGALLLATGLHLAPWVSLSLPERLGLPARMGWARVAI